MVGFEGLDGHRGVAEILEPQLVEIIAPDIDVEILAPIVLHPFVHDGAAGDELLDAVGAVAERRLERGRADVALPAGGVGPLPPMLRQHVELTQDQRHFTIARGIEDEGDFALPSLFHFRDMPIIGRHHRVVLLERLHGEDHILDRHRLAVVMARVGAQTVRRRAKIARMSDRFGNEPVVGRNFIKRRRQQRVGEHARARRDRSLQPGDDLVEVVERAQRHQPHAAALRRARVDVVEMLEAGRIFELSEQRQAMLPVERLFLRARGGAEKRRSKSVEDGG